jgi:prepilin peptidase CpaA
MMVVWAAGVLMAVAFLTDITNRKIPNWLTVPACMIGLVFHTASTGWGGLLFSGAGIISGLLPLLVLYLLRAVGAGDVKLFAAFGALLGVELTLQLMLASILCSGGIALLILLWRRELWLRCERVLFTLFRLLLLKERGELMELRTRSDYVRFPFMWAVLPGGAVTWWQWLA